MVTMKEWIFGGAVAYCLGCMSGDWSAGAVGREWIFGGA